MLRKWAKKTVGCGFLLANLIGFAGCQSEPLEPADLVLHRGKVVAVDAAGTEAQAIAVRNGRVMALGTDAEIAAFIGSKTQVIDLRGSLAIPGFIEGHGHFMGLGDSRLILDLRAAPTWDDVVGMVAEAAAQAAPGEWIRGRGWHQDKWASPPQPAVEGFPVHDSLSRVSPRNPVLLTHASGHATFVNGFALGLAGIDRQTADPAGGEILRDADGRPTGLLRETAMDLVRRLRDEGTPEEREAEWRKMAQLAAEECLRKGVTSFQDAGSSFETIDFFKKLVDEGALPLRLWVMVRESNEQLADKLSANRILGYGDGLLTVRAIKLSLDGALGSRGAWLLEPYSDAPNLTGLNLVTTDYLRETAELAIQHNYQLGVHAIGDRANRETLDIFEETFARYPDRKDRRWRIEHAQHLNPNDIPRFAQMGVIASMQAVHCTSDGPWVPDRLGDVRSEAGAYVWQKLMRTGAIVTNGTDTPVEDVSPIASYYSAVSRLMNDGRVFYPAQRMSRMEALRSYTINPAHAAYEEAIKGSLEVGKLADITVLSQDILTVAEQDIPKTEVLYTIVGGEVRYRKGA